MGTLHKFPKGRTGGDGPAAAAWEAYAALAQAWVDDPALRTDYAHCVALTRALGRFQKLFLESDAG